MRPYLARVFPVALILLAGCSNKDTEQLGRVARNVASKFDDLTGGAQEKLASGLQAARASWSETVPEARVNERLRWDKQLATAEIVVDAPAPGVVRLQGTVPDAELRQHAVELTHGTLGVEKVIDELKSGE